MAREGKKTIQASLDTAARSFPLRLQAANAIPARTVTCTAAEISAVPFMPEFPYLLLARPIARYWTIAYLPVVVPPEPEVPDPPEDPPPYEDPEDPDEPVPLELVPVPPLLPELSPARRSQPTAAMLSAATTKRIFEVVLSEFILVPFMKN